MKKRILSILLCLVMVLGLLPTAAFAAGTGSGTSESDPIVVNNYDDLKKAMTKSSKTYVKLGGDITTAGLNKGVGIVPDDVIVVGNHITLDLNGKTLTLTTAVSNVDYFIRVLHESLNIKDSGTNGTIKMENKDNAYFYGILVDAALTVESGTIKSENETGRNVSYVICANTRGDVTINGGTISNTDGFRSGKYICNNSLALWANHDSTLTINGGDFYGLVGIYADALSETAKKVINGGTFHDSVGFYKDDEYADALDVAIRGGTFIDGGYYYWYCNLGTQGFYMDHDDADTREYNESSYSFAAMFPTDTTILCEASTAKRIPACVLYGSADPITLVAELLIGDYQYTGVKRTNVIERGFRPTITVFSGGLSDMKLNAGESTIEANRSSFGKGTIAPDSTSQTITVTATAPDGLRELANDGTAKYTASVWLSKKTSGATDSTYLTNPTDYTLKAERDENGDPKVTLTLNETPRAGDVYSVNLFLSAKVQDGDNTLGLLHEISYWTLTTEAAPPEPVRHQIQISNGTIEVNGKPDLWAYAGDTVTVRATDRTSDNMMFTQWYTNTSGVTFTDVSKQTTTFVMPDCNVGVWPGFHGVEFTKQPAKTYWTQAGYEQTLTAAFSYPITEWELREGSKIVAFGGPVSANEDFTVTVPEQNTNASKTYTIVVTANGQEFSSNEFTVNWDVLGKAPAVEFDPIDGRQFVEALEVQLAPAYGTYRLRYTLDGTDPKDRKVDGVNVFDSAWGTSVTLKSTTTIAARTYDSTAVAEDSKWGPLSTATFYYVSALPTPKIIPGDMTYTDPFTVYLSALYLHDVSMEYQIVPQGETVDDDYGWTTYDRENAITVNEWGTVTLYARTFKSVDRQTDDGQWYIDRMTSEKAAATYSRSYTAEIEDVTVNGKVGEELSQDVVIRMSREKFKDVAAGTNVSAWFNLPDGLTATVKEINATNTVLTVTVSGTPTAASADAITVTIPKDNLTYNTADALTVLSNPKAYYSIGADDTHEHDFSGQSWEILNDEFHYQECKSGDGANLQPHNFGAWTQDASNDTQHYRVCSVCNHKVYAAHNESGHITDTPAGIGTQGTWHTECVYCGKPMNSGTLDALTEIAVANLTVNKPVKGEACANASTTDATYYVAYTEWMDQNGNPLTIGDTFKAGTVYTAKITLEGKDNNVFSANSNYDAIEGKTATVSPALTGDAYAYSVVLTYTFDATEGAYVPTKPTITTEALPDGKVGEEYTALLEATGDKPVTWSIASGDLPDGLTLVGDTIKGTPSKAGSFTVTVKASNGGGSDTKELTVKIADADSAKYHNVTLSGAGTGATGAGSHAAGMTVNIYAGTKSGYTFAGWTSDDVTVLSASSINASFVMPDKDVTIKANWTYNGSSGGGGYTYYTIKATAGVNGSISPSGNVSVREGRDQTFTITPDKGYAVARVLVDSKNVGAVKSYTFENVKKAHTIEVVFMKSSGNPPDRRVRGRAGGQLL